eukprot:PhM_4_TR15571/c0_g2_i1/m.59778
MERPDERWRHTLRRSQPAPSAHNVSTHSRTNTFLSLQTALEELDGLRRDHGDVLGHVDRFLDRIQLAIVALGDSVASELKLLRSEIADERRKRDAISAVVPTKAFLQESVDGALAQHHNVVLDAVEGLRAQLVGHTTRLCQLEESFRTSHDVRLKACEKDVSELKGIRDIVMRHNDAIYGLGAAHSSRPSPYSSMVLDGGGGGGSAAHVNTVMSSMAARINSLTQDVRNVERKVGYGRP